MRSPFTENNRPGFFINQVMNLDTSGTQNADNRIVTGTPLVLNLSGTAQPTTAQDGFAKGFQGVLYEIEGC